MQNKFLSSHFSCRDPEPFFFFHSLLIHLHKVYPFSVQTHFFHILVLRWKFPHERKTIQLALNWCLSCHDPISAPSIIRAPLLWKQKRIQLPNDAPLTSFPLSTDMKGILNKHQTESQTCSFSPQVRWELHQHSAHRSFSLLLSRVLSGAGTSCSWFKTHKSLFTTAIHRSSAEHELLIRPEHLLLPLLFSLFKTLFRNVMQRH